MGFRKIPLSRALPGCKTCAVESWEFPVTESGKEVRSDAC
jgi:hypothetical protein